MPNESSSKKNMKFEDALDRLGDIVDELENGKAPLDKSLKLFEEGVRLVRICSEKLEKAEQTVKKLTYISNDPEKDGFVNFGDEEKDEE